MRTDHPSVEEVDCRDKAVPGIIFAKKSAEKNRGTQSPLADFGITAHTSIAMATAAFPQLVVVRSTIQDARCSAAHSKTDTTNRLAYPKAWLRMWLVVLKVNGCRSRLESVCREFSRFNSNGSGLYRCPAEFEKMLADIRGLRQDVTDSNLYNDVLLKAFPRQVRRICKSKDAILDACDTLIASIPAVDPAIRERARLEHARGELVDFESFFNDLQRIQH